MNPTFSATGSQKTQTGSTPFDEITALEEQESARVEKEIEAMESEKEGAEQSLAKKEEAAEQEMKEQARKELLEYRETELTQIIKNAETEAVHETEKLEQDYEQRAPDAVKNLVHKLTDKDSFYSLAT